MFFYFLLKFLSEDQCLLKVLILRLKWIREHFNVMLVCNTRWRSESMELIKNVCIYKINRGSEILAKKACEVHQQCVSRDVSTH